MAAQTLFNVSNIAATTASTAANMISSARPLVERTANLLHQAIAKHGLFRVGMNVHLACFGIVYAITGAKMTYHTTRLMLKNYQNINSNSRNDPSVMKRLLLFSLITTAGGLGCAGYFGRNLYQMTTDS